MSSADLFVIQTEFSLYLLLRHWVYVKLHPHHTDTNEKKHVTYFAKLEGKTALRLDGSIQTCLH